MYASGGYPERTARFLSLSLATIVSLELLFFDPTATIPEAARRGLPTAISVAIGFAVIHLARWHYERKAA